jgi:hypothetical protein
VATEFVSCRASLFSGSVSEKGQPELAVVLVARAVVAGYTPTVRTLVVRGR